MKVTELEIRGVLLIEPTVFGDERGYFVESYQEERYQKAGIDARFVQDNHSLSGKGILRGLHLQKSKPQAKLVRVTEGRVLDVVVDVRRESVSFGTWCSVELSAENFKQLYVPAGCAHGFYVLSEQAQFQYKCSEYYFPDDELTLAWDDPDLAIDWRLEGAQPRLSEKDKHGVSFQRLKIEFDKL